MIPLPESLRPSDESYWSEFAAAGALWLYDPKVPTTLHGTSNGTEWTTVDLTEAGLPGDARRQASSHCDVDHVVDDRGESFVIVYVTSYGGSHSEGIPARIWLVEISAAGEVLSVRHSAENGLENMPPAENAWTFRSDCIDGFIDLPTGRMIVGGGQWWQPYLTSSYHLYSAIESADGTWSVYSTNTPPLGGDNGDPKVVAVTEFQGEAVVITRPLITDNTLSVWRSSDGRNWDVTVLDAIPDGEFHFGGRFRLVTSTDGSTLVLLAARERGPSDIVVSVWTSTDAVTWTRTDFEEEIDRNTPVLITTTTEGFAVILDLSTPPSLWTSPDGLEWIRSETELSWYAGDAIVVNGGLVNAYNEAILVSGLDWAPAE